MCLLPQIHDRIRLWPAEALGPSCPRRERRAGEVHGLVIEGGRKQMAVQMRLFHQDSKVMVEGRREPRPCEEDDRSINRVHPYGWEDLNRVSEPCIIIRVRTAGQLSS